MEAYEKIFLWLSVVTLVLFLGALAYAALVIGISLPGPAGHIIPKPGQSLPAAVLATPPFDHPGVKKLGPKKYEAVVLASAWAFTPNEIDVPAGVQVKFVATSLDITHGFFIPGTRVNMMLIPGYISSETYRFEKPGHYLLLCNEYCGILHHTMQAEVEVK